MPATAHGLQGRFNARTVTERKYPGACLIRRGQPRPRLRHGLYRYSRPQSENHNGNGSHGGPVAWHIHPSYPGIFLFSFQSARKVRPRFGPVCPGAPSPFIYHFIFQAFSVHLRNYFLKIFPCSEARARLPGAPPFRPRLRPWQCRSCSCRGRNGRRYVWPVCRADWKWPHGVPAW